MNLRDQLIRDEGGIRLHPYRDSEGFLTIGIGRNLDAKGISSIEAEFMFDNDIADATRELAKALPWTADLDDVRRAALINLTFNMGIAGLLSFRKALAALKAGDYETTHDEILDSRYEDQVGPRAHRVAQQLRTGVWT